MWPDKPKGVGGCQLGSPKVLWELATTCVVTLLFSLFGSMPIITSLQGSYLDEVTCFYYLNLFLSGLIVKCLVFSTNNSSFCQISFLIIYWVISRVEHGFNNNNNTFLLIYKICYYKQLIQINNNSYYNFIQLILLKDA